MKYIDEYRDERIARGLAAEIHQLAARSCVLMEICGGQTHTIMRYGLDELLPKEVELVHGPGCPVCVTPLETIDKAIELATRPDVTLVSSASVAIFLSALFNERFSLGASWVFSFQQVLLSGKRPVFLPFRWKLGSRT